VRRLTVVVAVSAAALAAASVAAAGLGFSMGVSNAFRSATMTCIRQYTALGGLAGQVLRGAEAARLQIALQPPSSGNQSFALLARYKPTGEIVIKVEWAAERGTYKLDGAPQVSCAILLHELRHAWDMDSGRITGSETDRLSPAVLRNASALKQALYIEGLAVQAENYYLWRHGLRQRRHYGLFRLTKCIPHPRSQGSYYLQGCYGTFILPSWVLWH
jgi:hypothetical protein